MLIYQCPGRHFKAYNSQHREVLEHPSDTESVSLNFLFTDQNPATPYLVIEVQGYVHSRMRVAGQRRRIDIYVLQHLFRPLIDQILPEQLAQFNITDSKTRRWRYGEPIARGDRQGVPNLVKLAEVEGITAIVPFQSETLAATNATMVVDSEIPGRDQTRWIREGGERQIHMGIFHGTWKPFNEQRNSVRVGIPVREIRNNFLLPIRDNWVDE